MWGFVEASLGSLGLGGCGEHRICLAGLGPGPGEQNSATLNPDLTSSRAVRARVPWSQMWWRIVAHMGSLLQDLMGGRGALDMHPRDRVQGLESKSLKPGTLTLTSPGEDWTKAPVVTDKVALVGSLLQGL